MIQFSEREYQDLCQRIHSDGVCEGRQEARVEMGKTLDYIINNMIDDIPYRFPIWMDDYIQIRPDPNPPTKSPRIKCIEMSKLQLNAIRCLLCGPPDKRG